MQKVLWGLLLACWLITTSAAELSPVGVWKTIDDETRQPKSLVQISEQNGVLEGRVIKLFRAPEQDQNPRCDKCEGARKDQPILGMTILSGLRRDGDAWRGGEIVDPKTGSIYKARLRVIEEGQKLEVRGFVGVSLFGRTQLWLREPG